MDNMDRWRFNAIDTEVSVTDAASMLTPAVKEQIVQAVLERVLAHQRSERAVAAEQRVGAERGHDADAM